MRPRLRTFVDLILSVVDVRQLWARPAHACPRNISRTRSRGVQVGALHLRATLYTHSCSDLWESTRGFIIAGYNVGVFRVRRDGGISDARRT